LVPPDKARYSREHVGSEYIGWLHFQPHYQEALAENSDMLS
ncbi:MAG: class II aldolase/adducin family protein, partial [Pseudomonadota bacterium]